MREKSNEKSLQEKLNLLVDKQKLKQKLLELGIEHFTDKTLERIYNCGNFLQSVLTEDLKRSKIVKSNRCMNRFCPICAVTKARKNGFMLGVVLNYLSNERKYEFLFLTLTVRNVLGTDLKSELDKQYESLKRFIQRKEFKAISLGYLRKTEVTYNSARNDFHPHIHMLIAVGRTYFTNPKKYVRQDKWLELWKECRRDDGIMQVHITKANRNSFAELAKYEAKATDMLNYDESVFDVFYTALKGRKTLTWNGCFLEGKKKFKSGALDHLMELDENEYFYIAFHSYKIDSEKYELSKMREMTPKEIEKYVNKFEIIDEDISDDSSEDN